MGSGWSQDLSRWHFVRTLHGQFVKEDHRYTFYRKNRLAIGCFQKVVTIFVFFVRVAEVWCLDTISAQGASHGRPKRAKNKNLERQISQKSRIRQIPIQVFGPTTG